MNLTLQYDALKNEVETFLELVHQALRQNPSAEPLYKGCVVMYSSLLEVPPFLFIGINPGDELKESEQPKKDLDPGDGFEYTNAVTDVDYRLTKQTRGLFEMAGMGNLLEKSVKTNVYYIATSNVKDLWQLFSLLGEDMNRRLHENAFKWTRRMIEMIKPKTIICEGIMPFSFTFEVRQNMHQSSNSLESRSHFCFDANPYPTGRRGLRRNRNGWRAAASDLSHFKLEFTPFNKLSEIYGVSKTRESVCGYFELPDKTPVIGYSRNRSNIQNKCFVADFLRKKCNK